MMVKDGDTPLGWATVMHKVSWGWSPDTFDRESGKYDITSKLLIAIESLEVASWAEHRNDVASILVRELLEKAHKSGADVIDVMRVDVDDSAVIEALRGAGFERIATSYTMKRMLNEKS